MGSNWEVQEDTWTEAPAGEVQPVLCEPWMAYFGKWKKQWKVRKVGAKSEDTDAWTKTGILKNQGLLSKGWWFHLSVK